MPQLLGLILPLLLGQLIKGGAKRFAMPALGALLGKLGPAGAKIAQGAAGAVGKYPGLSQFAGEIGSFGAGAALTDQLLASPEQVSAGQNAAPLNSVALMQYLTGGDTTDMESMVQALQSIGATEEEIAGGLY